MENAKRARGRPKKQKGTMELWRFVRAGLIISAYDEAREGGQKHSAAVTQAVEYIRQHHPEMPVSATTVKRTLATFRSREGSPQFKRSTVGKREIPRFPFIIAETHGRQIEIVLPLLSSVNLLESLTAYMFGYAKRPQYPRHNQKIPKK